MLKLQAKNTKIFFALFYTRDKFHDKFFYHLSENTVKKHFFGHALRNFLSGLGKGSKNIFGKFETSSFITVDATGVNERVRELNLKVKISAKAEVKRITNQ